MRIVLPGRHRCRHHGGRYKAGLGARTAAALAVLQAGRAKRQAQLKAAGLPWYGGAPRKGKRLQGWIEKAVVMADRAIMVIEEGLAGLPDVPDEEKPAPRLLAEAMRVGLINAKKIAGQVLLVDERTGQLVDLKQQRIVSDTAAWLVRMGLRAAEGEERTRRDDVLGRLLAAIEADQAKL